ncbi:VirB8/TrbF family protein [Parachitinimonas caeni]|uniref:VirB8/TrbF family protein n=1 Tax=Parachitinimonas caeni TaxID=3031301 RepID=A0ABT7E2T2_9NEIS|nr:VirB8/TrbF family protein [Parachitinimonas caeni]MDK2126636.1 VirB8/TrbF family protein [Parachitinimonas caeni]
MSTNTHSTVAPTGAEIMQPEIGHTPQKENTAKQKPNKGVDSPYLEARREWNERYGSYISQARNWRLCAIISCLTTLASVVGLAYIGAQNKIVPYVVQVDKNGVATASGAADKAQAADERVVKAYIGRFITDMRTVSPDLVAEKAGIERVYSMISNGSPALVKLNEHFQKNNPFTIVANSMVAIEITSVLPITEKTWQVEWNEIIRDRRGELTANNKMRASITIEVTPPKDEKLLLVNPLGIYITDLNWVQSLQ